MLFPGGKTKAFNITYDDGVTQDVRFVALLNKYGVKGTFNLNSQLMEEEFAWQHPCGMEVRRLSPEAARRLYDGHEVASHSLTHPDLHGLPEEELWRQLGEDKRRLEALFGKSVEGFAVPFDYCDERIAHIARACGFSYLRTGEVTGDYSVSPDPFWQRAGFYHIQPGLTDFVAGFLNTSQPGALCQLVGHSYDLDTENLWGTLELILAAVSAREDVWLCTHAELMKWQREHLQG